ncbi:MAG: hypothetical protein IPP51_15250 [Bacteroidetes bacterium]|nr:hypothetical protein [Bacteroidota bacterium]
MDKSVHFTFLIACLLAGSLLLVRCQKCKECVLPEIVFEPANPLVGDSVRCHIANSNSVLEWQGSDGTVSTDSLPVFVMRDTGHYVITATNGNCKQTAEFSVQPAVVIPTITPVYSISSREVVLGGQFVLEDNTPDATGRTWKVEGDELPSTTQKKTTFKFVKEGEKRIYLDVVTPINRGREVITVIVKPKIIMPPPTGGGGGGRKLQFERDDILTAELRSLVQKNRIKDFYNNLCDKESTPTKVSAPGAKIANFYDFKETVLIRDWKILEVMVKRASEDGCIQELYIKVSN